MFERGNRDAAAVRAAFAPDASLAWDGSTAGAGAAVDRWLREMQPRDAALSFDRIEAQDHGRVRVTGFVIFSARPEGEDAARNYRAGATLDLARDGQGRLRIVSARVRRFIRA